MRATLFAVALAATFMGASVWLLGAQSAERRRLATLCGIAGGSPDPTWPARAARDGPLRAAMRSLQAARHRSARRRRRRGGVLELCFALGSELHAGRTPPEALERAVAIAPAELRAEWAGVVAAARTGGEVVAALRSAGVRPGAEGLRRLAACWQVGSGSGAGFALAVERLAVALRAEEEHRQDVATELAGTRSTARLLAALPLIGLLMATAMGMRPVHFLLATPYGLGCLVLGGALDVAGLVWTRRLARSAEEGR